MARKVQTHWLARFVHRANDRKCIAEADADLIPGPGQLELQGSLNAEIHTIADVLVGMEGLELHGRCRGSQFPKISESSHGRVHGRSASPYAMGHL